MTGTLTIPGFGPPVAVSFTLDIDTVSWARGPGYATDTRWFFDNEWYKQVFYSVAPDLLFGTATAAACTGPTDCLSSDGGTLYNRDAVLILAARAINGVTRPTNVLADYLEAPNLAGAQDFRTHRRSPAPTENDKVAIVAP
ncbi:MAG: hypothetical protein HC807_05310 [Gammaproteobacteria bacterium]|nr:hypothetical protein [Gammaproteobacteria bacterium]